MMVNKGQSLSVLTLAVSYSLGCLVPLRPLSAQYPFPDAISSTFRGALRRKRQREKELRKQKGLQRSDSTTDRI